MYVKTFGYGMSTVLEMKGATDTFAVVWAVTMLNCLGLTDIILLCEPEPSLIKWAESVQSKRLERTVIRSSPDDHIRATEELKIIRNNCKDQCGQCKNAHSTDRLLTVL